MSKKKTRKTSDNSSRDEILTIPHKFFQILYSAIIEKPSKTQNIESLSTEDIPKISEDDI